MNIKNMKRLISKDERETLRFAKKFAKKLRGGEVVALIGELGAGKTVFVKGLARGFGIKKRIQSPTFLLMRVYEIKKESNQRTGKKTTLSRGLRVKFLIHVDTYRVGGASELVDIGFLDWLGRPDTVTVIEWADKVAELLRGRKVIKINFKMGEKEDERIIEVKRNE